MSETIQVVLDLNKYIVTYYKIYDSQKIKKLKEDNLLRVKQKYYFALCVDSERIFPSYESVVYKQLN